MCCKARVSFAINARQSRNRRPSCPCSLSCVLCNLTTGDVTSVWPPSDDTPCWRVMLGACRHGHRVAACRASPVPALSPSVARVPPAATLSEPATAQGNPTWTGDIAALQSCARLGRCCHRHQEITTSASQCLPPAHWWTLVHERSVDGACPRRVCAIGSRCLHTVHCACDQHYSRPNCSCSPCTFALCRL